MLTELEKEKLELLAGLSVNNENEQYIENRTWLVYRSNIPNQTETLYFNYSDVVVLSEVTHDHYPIDIYHLSKNDENNWTLVQTEKKYHSCKEEILISSNLDDLILKCDALFKEQINTLDQKPEPLFDSYIKKYIPTQKTLSHKPPFIPSGPRQKKNTTTPTKPSQTKPSSGKWYGDDSDSDTDRSVPKA